MNSWVPIWELLPYWNSKYEIDSGNPKFPYRQSNHILVCTKDNLILYGAMFSLPPSEGQGESLHFYCINPTQILEDYGCEMLLLDISDIEYWMPLPATPSRKEMK